MSDIKTYLRLLFELKPETSHICIWRFPEKLSAWFTTIESAAAFVEAHKGQNIYAELAASPEDFGPYNRCAADKVVGLPGLWADVDNAGAGAAHQKKNLPPSFELALTILPADFQPSLIVNSGHGLHAYWLFKEYELFEHQEDRERAATIVKRWERYIRMRAQAKGWTIDAVHDLARILRIPGTMNTKVPEEPAPCAIYEDSGKRYNLSEFEDYLEAMPMIDAVNLVPIIAKPVTQVSMDGIVIGHDRRMSPEKIELLCEADMKFADTWHHARPEFTDQSQSSYDLAIGNLLFEAGCADQEIVDALIANRDLHGGKTKLEASYHRRTLSRIHAKIRAGGGMSDETVEVLGLNGPATLAPSHDEVIAAVPGIDPLWVKGTLCESLSRTLGIMFRHAETGEMVTGIMRVVKYTGSKPSWRIDLRNGDYINFSSGTQFEKFPLFRTRIWEHTNIMIEGDFPKEKWKPVMLAISNAMIEVDGGADSDERGQLRMLLDRYLADQGVAETKEEVFEAGGPIERPFKFDGRVAVSSPDLRKYAMRQWDIKKELNEYGSGFTALGAYHKIFYVPGRSTQNRWILPEDFKPDSYQHIETTGRIKVGRKSPPPRAAMTAEEAAKPEKIV